MRTRDNRTNMRALQAFEAVSRHNSISRAADELGVTQSAVSHQLRRLSADLGENLIVKSGRGVALTATGLRLAEKLRSAFTQIDRSVAEAIGVSRAVVRLALCSCFAPGWLIPRLPSFYAANPDIDLQLKMYALDPKLTDEVADAFITTPSPSSGYWSLLLAEEVLVPVMAGRVSEAVPTTFITTDLDQGKIGDDWKAYCAQSGRDMKLPDGKNWLFASHYVMALDMVRAGLGAALVPDFLARTDIASGRIVLLDEVGVPTLQDYFLCIKEARRHEPALEALAKWFNLELSRQDEHQSTPPRH